MRERFIDSNGVPICTESYGCSSNPTVLLIMGATASMIWWEDEFCQRLASNGLHVIRFDNRDVGRSVVYEHGKPKYTYVDMADDAAHVLNAYGVEQAHIVGMSMGGMLAQILALRNADKVLSLTLMMTSNFDRMLPPTEEKVANFFVSHVTNWSDASSIVQYTVEKWRILSGTKHSFPQERVTKLAEEEVKRANNPPSMENHVFVTGGEDYLLRTKEIITPTLVIHGTEDPIIRYEHGVNLTKIISSAKLLTLEGTGHEIHPSDWDEIINAITHHVTF